MASKIQERTISQTGGELGGDFVTLSQNQTAPQMETPVISFECPRKYEWIEWDGQQHPTRFIPRRLQTVTGTANDDTVVALDNNIQPVAGDRDLDKQDFPVVIAADNNGNEVDITDVNYAQNEVTLAQDPADGTDFYVYPVISEGTINVRGVNQFDQVEGTTTDWGSPLYRFSDFPQLKRGTEVNLDGGMRWSRYERMEIIIDSPYTVQWTHGQFPRGAYVSQLEQDVDIHL